MMPEIPVIDIGTGGASALAKSCPEQVTELRLAMRRRFGALGLRLGDVATRSWLRRSENPFLAEFESLAELWNGAGVYILNAMSDFSSTSAAVTDHQGYFRLVRVVDWRVEGAGRNLVLARQRGAAGAFLALTWPGMVGVISAMAKGRFAAALNQPPQAIHRLGKRGDWLINRVELSRHGGLPADHLLRQVFETAPDFVTARQMLCDTPLAASAIFTLVGVKPGEGCVIERTRTEAAVRPGPAAAANHWCQMPLAGHAIGKDSAGRQRAMERLLNYPPARLTWLAPPVLNKDTRVAMVADPLAGTLVAQGWDRCEQVTCPLVLNS
ncbi:carcinine hydrolase/isopenicillin-N N-acyltransferase family protein [Telmatospirillum siberiense]|uniref:Uncharacterized protein n=1 Tax=Telmatospirillum siberiense TaxID=382514 RepID=A0A2N3PXD1_9PROT|nr:carcinine hydrolase/isopenicillin-N N-acyltransferase family protein [Telmatospirillum siberiense]PKU25064.1 hypothetical protein CWS72_07580 [Telmatospirillum siberiense]